MCGRGGGGCLRLNTFEPTRGNVYCSVSVCVCVRAQARAVLCLCVSGFCSSMGGAQARAFTAGLAGVSLYGKKSAFFCCMLVAKPSS